MEAQEGRFRPFLAVAVWSSPAEARCTLDRAAFLAVMADRYGEVRVAVALSTNGLVVEVFAKPDGSTWTITTTTVQGVICVLGVGQDWQKVVPKLGNPT